MSKLLLKTTLVTTLILRACTLLGQDNLFQQDGEFHPAFNTGPEISYEKDRTLATSTVNMIRNTIHDGLNLLTRKRQSGFRYLQAPYLENSSTPRTSLYASLKKGEFSTFLGWRNTFPAEVQENALARMQTTFQQADKWASDFLQDLTVKNPPKNWVEAKERTPKAILALKKFTLQMELDIQISIANYLAAKLLENYRLQLNWDQYQIKSQDKALVDRYLKSAKENADKEVNKAWENFVNLSKSNLTSDDPAYAPESIQQIEERIASLPQLKENLGKVVTDFNQNVEAVFYRFRGPEIIRDSITKDIQTIYREENDFTKINHAQEQDYIALEIPYRGNSYQAEISSESLKIVQQLLNENKESYEQMIKEKSELENAETANGDVDSHSAKIFELMRGKKGQLKKSLELAKEKIETKRKIYTLIHNLRKGQENVIIHQIRPLEQSFLSDHDVPRFVVDLFQKNSQQFKVEYDKKVSDVVNQLKGTSDYQTALNLYGESLKDTQELTEKNIVEFQDLEKLKNMGEELRKMVKATRQNMMDKVAGTYKEIVGEQGSAANLWRKEIAAESIPFPLVQFLKSARSTFDRELSPIESAISSFNPQDLTINSLADRDRMIKDLQEVEKKHQNFIENIQLHTKTLIELQKMAKEIQENFLPGNIALLKMLYVASEKNPTGPQADFFKEKAREVHNDFTMIKQGMAAIIEKFLTDKRASKDEVNLADIVISADLQQDMEHLKEAIKNMGQSRFQEVRDLVLTHFSQMKAMKTIMGEPEICMDDKQLNETVKVMDQVYGLWSMVPEESDRQLIASVTQKLKAQSIKSASIPLKETVGAYEIMRRKLHDKYPGQFPKEIYGVKPPVLRRDMAGVRNYGNTCYLNSCTSTIALTKLSDLTSPGRELQQGKKETDAKFALRKKMKDYLNQLVDAMAEGDMSGSNAVSLKYLEAAEKVYGNKLEHRGAQQDPQEYLNNMLDFLEATGNDYELEIAESTSRDGKEPTWGSFKQSMLNVPVAAGKSLQEIVHKYLEKEDVSDLKGVVRQMTILNAPKTLLIQPKRYTNSLSKNHDLIRIPFKLNVPWRKKTGDRVDDKKDRYITLDEQVFQTPYKLKSIIVHEGGYGGGHYITYSVGSGADGKLELVRHDDSSVSAISPAREKMEWIHVQENAYLLVYEEAPKENL